MASFFVAASFWGMLGGFARMIARFRRECGDGQ